MKYFGFIVLIMLCLSGFGQSLQSGDMLFVSSEKSDFEKAITTVTKENLQETFSHVGLVWIDNDRVFIIEANPQQGVVKNLFSDFQTEHSNNVLYHARLKKTYRKFIPNALDVARSRIGKAYDFAFDFGNDSYYCSELIYLAFSNSSGDSAFFETPSMTFKSPETGDFLPYWVHYFAKQKMAIPEGKPGLNPNSMARSDKFVFFKPMN